MTLWTTDLVKQGLETTRKYGLLMSGKTLAGVSSRQDEAARNRGQRVMSLVPCPTDSTNRILKMFRRSVDHAGVA
jgi:hypothetical protein